jgi:outer membrane lipoprotein SlyB
MNPQTLSAFLDVSRAHLLRKGNPMEPHNVYKPGGILYPIMVIAGVSVTVFSLLGTATLMGRLPAAQSAVFDHPEAAATPASAPQTTPTVNHATDRGKVSPAVACASCGTITAINATEVKGQGSGLGVVAGGVTGAILGNQIGNGNGRTAATLLGAAGGAYVGNEIEKNTKTTTRYAITVRMSDGSYRIFHRSTLPQFAIGQKVRVEGDTLRPLVAS